MIKTWVSYGIVVFFFAQIGYLSWHLPQLILLGLDFTDGVKLSFVMAGLSLGVLFLMKKGTPPPPIEPDE